MNPTGVPLILHNILKLIDFESLKVSRLVCKTWEFEANKFIRVSTEPFILSEESIVLKSSTCSPSISTRTNHITIDNDLLNPSSVLDFLSRDTSGYRFQIRSLELKNPNWKWSQLEQLLDLFEKLEELILTGDFILPRTEITDAPRNNRKILKNLHTLYLNVKDEYLQNFVYTGLLQEISCKAPNIQQLKFCSNAPFSSKFSYTSTISSQVLFLNSLHNSLNLKVSNRITSLCINFDMRNEDIRFLRNADLPLKKLQFSVEKSLSPSLVDELLDSLKNTLVHLSLTHRECSRCVPKLDTLSRLEFLAVYDYIIGEKYKSTYETQIDKNEDDFVPSDAQRRRSSVEFIPKRLFPSSSVSGSSVFTNMETIKLCSIYFDETDVINFRRYFPNLIKLQISYLSDDELSIIIKEFPRLEILEAPQGLYTDAGLTGISPEMQDILSNGVTNEVRVLNSMNAFPSITHMKKLQVLKLSSENVTDFGVVNGISNCKSVFVLIIDFPQVTDITLQKISMKMPRLDHLHFIHGTFSNEAIGEFKSTTCIPSTIFPNKRK